MIVTLLLWAYILILCLVYGFIATTILNAIAQNRDEDIPAFSVLFVAGLCLLTAVTGYLSLLINIGLLAHSIVIAFGLLAIVLRHKQFVALVRHYLEQFTASGRAYKVCCLGICIAVLLATIQQPTWYDTGLYDAQAIQWIEQYKAVPGLGNLHGRLAFNSMWLLASAFFSLSFLQIQPFHVLNGIFYTVIALHLIHGIFLLKVGTQALSRYSGLILIVISGFFLGSISSPEPDIPVALLAWLTFMLLFDYLARSRVELDSNSLLLLIIIPSAITMKLSVLPLMLVFVYLLYRSRRFLALPTIVILSAALLAPWLVRYSILSGYPIYPFPYIDIFPVDWKIPLQQVIAEQRHIQLSARALEHTDLTSITFGEALAIWIRNFRIAMWLNTLITIPGILFYLGYTVYNYRNYKTLFRFINIHRDAALSISMIIAGLVYWFIMAPDLRFGFSYLFLFTALLLTPLVRSIIERFRLLSSLLLALLPLYFIAIAIYSADLSALKQRIILPAGYPSVATEMQNVDGIQIQLPATGDLCWNAPIPCTPYLSPSLELRGPSLEDGFKQSGQ